MDTAISSSQFVQIALPIILTLSIAAWLNSRGIDGVGRRIDDLRADMNGRFQEVNQRLDRIDTRPGLHGQKIAALEERTLPLGRR